MISIYGYSDDVVVIEGDVEDEVSPGQLITIGGPEQGVRVRFTYAPGKRSGPVWRGSIEQIAEGAPMFPVTIAESTPLDPQAKSYSVKITVDCPLGTHVVVGKKLHITVSNTLVKS